MFNDVSARIVLYILQRKSVRAKCTRNYRFPELVHAIMFFSPTGTISYSYLI